MINVSVTPQRSHECAPYGLAVTQDNAWRLPIVAGHLSIAVFECAALTGSWVVWRLVFAVSLIGCGPTPRRLSM